MPGIKDITGQRFGRLVAIKRISRGKYKNAQWLCQCDCGHKHKVLTGNLRIGGTISCGRHRGKHGYSGRTKNHHPLYEIWCAMRSRCNNPNNHAYKDYGGRGIKVCKRWNDFTNFIADVGERPPNHSLNRINNNGNYNPKNVRWSTPLEQRHNRRPEEPRKRIGQFTTVELKTELKRRTHLKRAQAP